MSKNILTQRAKLRWCFREKSMAAVDNGWRFLSEIDTDEYLSEADNFSVCDFNTVARIEPAVLLIYDMEVGTDLELVVNDGKKYFADASSGEILNI